jgi:6-phosphogluconolactonase/glucosamine-6-phosphate isomerase/deaminase
MTVHNAVRDLSKYATAQRDEVYLAVTTDKKLYVIKQVGARSWDAFNMDAWAGGDEHIHSNRKEVLDAVREKLDIES